MEQVNLVIDTVSMYAPHINSASDTDVTKTRFPY